jgi:hypothetical protein
LPLFFASLVSLDLMFSIFFVFSSHQNLPRQGMWWQPMRPAAKYRPRGVPQPTLSHPLSIHPISVEVFWGMGQYQLYHSFIIVIKKCVSVNIVYFKGPIDGINELLKCRRRKRSVSSSENRNCSKGTPSSFSFFFPDQRRDL